MLHEQDDFGYPLNPQCCAACTVQAQRMYDRFLASILSPDGHDHEVSYRKPSHDKELPE